MGLRMGLMSDRLSEIEQQLPAAGYWYENAKWLVAELHRQRKANAELQIKADHTWCELARRKLREEVEQLKGEYAFCEEAARRLDVENERLRVALNRHCPNCTDIRVEPDQDTHPGGS